jgi:hypothetical protein
VYDLAVMTFGFDFWPISILRGNFSVQTGGVPGVSLRAAISCAFFSLEVKGGLCKPHSRIVPKTGDGSV